MQTFLPYKDFEKSARVLDYRRLGKQRVEGYQILRILKYLQKHPTGKIAWQNHPAVRMWKGHEARLAQYVLAMCDEWKRRGYKDTLGMRIRRMKFPPGTLSDPPWLGSPSFHMSHRSNLTRKDAKYYSRFWNTPGTFSYVWPV